MARLEVGIRDLKNDLSRLVGKVRDGNEIVVTDRGKAVARMIPLRRADPLEALIAKGLVERASGSVRRRVRPRIRLRGPGPSAADYVRQQRR